jgi:hypothetical protein
MCNVNIASTTHESEILLKWTFWNHKFLHFNHGFYEQNVNTNAMCGLFYASVTEEQQ